MKKNFLLLSICTFISSLVVKAQNIDDSATFVEKGQTIKGFSFASPVCNKSVLVDGWKYFIQKHKGKVKGGIVNKAKGEDIRFLPSGQNWNGSFFYNFNEDKTISILTSFQNLSGSFLNDYSSDEINAALDALENFRWELQKSCNLDDLNNAQAYHLSLKKEKVKNLDKIFVLEKNIKTNQKKIGLKEGGELTDKELTSLGEMRQTMILNRGQVKTLKDKNDSLDKEIESQEKVLKRFEDKLQILETAPINDINATSTDFNLTDEALLDSSE